MRNETIAIHAGYDPDPTTKSVAVPIYQTVAYAFDSADHGAALFNLETEGFRYSRIANPTTAVLEKRVADLEGGVGALAVGTGQAALHFALVNLADTGGNIVSVPQLYGTTHTLLAHVLPRQGITGRFADSDKPDAIEKLIDETPRRCSPRPSATLPAMSATSRRWRKWRTATACRSSSTTRSQPRSC